MIDRMSRLVAKSRKDISKDEVSVNAQLLERGGFVSKLAAGIYSYLPLGLKVLTAIESIVRDEMNTIGSEEVLLPALTPKAVWEATGRWTDPGTEVQFQLRDNGGREFGLGFSHEEIVTPLVSSFVRSYRDVPASVYQIQTKFRDEPRAKSGLLRGREFRMKDMYSFHLDPAELDRTYEQVATAYQRVFARLELEAFRVKALGGVFSSEPSDEFSVEAAVGEDTVFRCDRCDFAENREITAVSAGDRCPRSDGVVREVRAIELGNTFRLGDKYSRAIGWTLVDRSGQPQPVLMGCYGIGISRLMGAIVELHHDTGGIVWPQAIAPYSVQLVNLTKGQSDEADAVAATLDRAGLSVLYDDRPGVGPGVKLADADLIGLPVRVVVSDRSLANRSVEVKARSSDGPSLVEPADVVTAVRQQLG
jgi:prolyl-tRNA synthetase